ncbi:hypothetical protein DSCA_53620 [Desulfosarcina alkanivorans]|jgi:PAS domain-containing protein|uniref:EAL domain-containing protein n=1 Tax=Desulfosarcina alkanivorans TaxID=571177 RepID=A0A5K7YNS4_9BACT|nr:hypothetical protein [Desulfosarcina alkanivorans]BBO71432.1 hypothetical protein DSCA_53620 [Desulfosarcina alkanivorans]
MKPMPELFKNLALFRIFAARPAAEFIRLETETEFKSREAQLGVVFECALDAIAELDQDFGVLLMNPSVRQLFDAGPV